MGSPETVPMREALVNNVLRILRARLGSWRGPDMGLREAIVWSTALDLWYRYGALLRALPPEDLQGSRILEVGPGWFGLELVLPEEFYDEGRLIQVEVLKRPMWRRMAAEELVIASGLRLPFRDDSFDYVVAMDVLEHIPSEGRERFCEELKRVARLGVVAHMPLQGGDFVGEKCYREHRDWQVTIMGRADPNTEEHLRRGHPTPQELHRYFPGCDVVGTLHARDWTRFVRLGRVPLVGFLAGLLVYLGGMSSEPPFYGGLMVWRS